MSESSQEKAKATEIVLGDQGKRIPPEEVRQRANRIMQEGPGSSGGSFMEDIGVDTHTEFPGSPKTTCPVPPEKEEVREKPQSD